MIFWVFASFLIAPLAAHAYLDPGTGSYLFQLIIAGALGASFAVRIFWRNIRAFFAGMFSSRSRAGTSPTKVEKKEESDERSGNSNYQAGL